MGAREPSTLARFGEMEGADGVSDPHAAKDSETPFGVDSGLFAQRHSRQSAPVATRTPTITSYRDDPLYPRIARAVEAILKSGNVVAPVDVLIGMGLLTREQLEDWRRGRMPYLERIINCNVSAASTAR